MPFPKKGEQEEEKGKKKGGAPFAFRKKKATPAVEAEAHKMDAEMVECPKCGCEFNAKTGEY